MLEIRTLGGLSILENGEPINDLGTRKAEALLLYLAVEGGDHRRNAVAALLWPESSEIHARTSLRVALSALRRNLGAYLDIDREKLAIRPDSEIYVDTTDLLEKIAQGRYLQALELYHGDFLKGFHLHGGPDFDQWRIWEQEYLQREMINALHKLIDQALEVKAYRGAIDYSQRMLKLDPLDERAYRLSMLALAQDGQRGAALAQYKTCRRVLLEQLGVEPAKDLIELHDQISRGEDRVILPYRSRRQNLPTQHTSFVGRQEELVRISDSICNPTCRLITIAGPGGIGKTRLAIQVASRSLSSFPDGVGFVHLSAVSSVETMIPLIADSFGFAFDTIASSLDPRSQVLEYLADRALLLVLDSFEHLIAEDTFLEDVLERSMDVTILVTSRERLNLQGEWVFFLEGLPVPGDSKHGGTNGPSALTLFEDRARQARYGRHYSTEERDHAIRICKLVEGMPLAIELAAAWSSMLSFSAIALEVEKSIDFLTTTMRDVPERHRSLRAVFDHSWNLLSSGMQTIYRNLAVFQGGFERDAAKQVAGANLSHLLALIGKSLLTRSADDRFDLHGLLRIFAGEMLETMPDERNVLMDRYCRFYLDILLRNENEFIGPAMIRARNQVRNEIKNIRHSMNWAVTCWEQNEAIPALRAFFAFYLVHGWYEGVNAFESLTQTIFEQRIGGELSVALEEPLYLSARVHKAFFCANLGMINESEEISQECLEPIRKLGMEEELSLCLQNLGVSAAFRGDYDISIRRLNEAIAVGIKTHYIAWPSYYLWLGYTQFLQGDYEEGMDNFKTSYQLFHQKGSSWGQAFALSKLGLGADGLSDYSRAMEYYQSALAIFEETNDFVGQAYTLSRMSVDAYGLEEYERALQLGEKGHAMFCQVGHRWGICASLGRKGFAYIGLNQPEKSRECFYEVLEMSRVYQMVPLSLYALLGLSCLLSRAGKYDKAMELFAVAQNHPRTPALYIDLSKRWFTEGLPPPYDQTPESGLLDDILDSLLNER